MQMGCQINSVLLIQALVSRASTMRADMGRIQQTIDVALRDGALVFPQFGNTLAPSGLADAAATDHRGAKL